MGLPPKLPGYDLPPTSKYSLVCPRCGRKISVVSLGKNGKTISVTCPICDFKIGAEVVNELIRALRSK
jgi:transcription elongation factor Elf1